tara:strand:- start:165 stop:332 length:168 start_codon:yes stop_codon:yes gene_type:complete
VVVDERLGGLLRSYRRTGRATLLVAFSGNGKLCALWEAEIAATAMRGLIDVCIWF